MTGDRRLRLGIDTGGTFTDVVGIDETTGRVLTTKTPSTPDDPARGFMDAVDKLLAAAGADGRSVAAVAHGTTVATNALLEGEVGRLGLVTTAGYRDILEIARQSVPDGYGNSYFWVKPPRIVPVHRVREVGGRLDHTGRELRPFDTGQARRIARWFAERQVDTVGVCLLHSYANPAHERAMREVLAAEHPDAVVSISSDVLREYREYERTVTTLVDASVKPRVGRYLAAVARRLAAAVTAADADDGTAGGPDRGGGRDTGGDPVPFFVMKSNGGVVSADQVTDQPITTVLSGPAAGALGAAVVARGAGFEDILTLDGGGTSTDVSVVRGGQPSLTTEGSIGRFASKIPMIDIVTVGSGGGSIAWISPEGNLKVGPASAGADPGPIAYGQGGTDPTITDAHVLLGRLPEALLGGEMPLDAAAARAGIAQLAGDLGLGIAEAARGVLEVAAFNQANAIRQVTVKRGLDVRDFAMVAFGGSGPLLGCRLIDVLGLRAVVVPRDPGNLSAFGLLTVDVRNDYVQTHVVRDDLLDLDELSAVYAALRARAAEALDREGFARADRRFERTADLRYDGQAFEVRVPAPAGAVDEDFRRAVVDAFHDAHEELYGYCYRDEDRHGVEWVNLRVTGVGAMRRPELPHLADGDGDPGRARTATRDVHWDDARAPTPIYERAGLRAGDDIPGPAVLEEFSSTVPIPPGFAGRVDRLGNVILTRSRS